MAAYNFTPIHTLSPYVDERKAARKKVIERTRELERESYSHDAKKTSIARDQASKYINLDVSLHEVRDELKGVEISNTRLEQRMDGVEKGVAQTNTTVAKT